MMSTCFNPLSTNKVLAVIPQDKMIDFANDPIAKERGTKDIISRLYGDFVTMYHELGNASNETFQRISSIGTMAKISLLSHKIPLDVCRLIDLLIMKHVYYLYNENEDIEFIIGDSTGEYTLDFTIGWIQRAE